MDNGTEIECNQCLEQRLETVCTVLNGGKSNTTIQNVRNKQKKRKKLQNNFDRNAYESIYDLNHLFAWQMPWIMVLVSTIQVMIIFLYIC